VFIDILLIFIRIYYSKSLGCIFIGLLAKYFVMGLIVGLSQYGDSKTKKKPLVDIVRNLN